ncbi:MAG: ABC-F family ATP-binding cassette domain-containing protein [Planctomycetaceae bacterium]
MILLTAKSLTRQFDVDPVFRNIGFTIHSGEKIGLVGRNGTGKTTLLNILAGIDEPDTGTVERHPSIDVALLEQEANLSSEATLLDIAKSGLAHLYDLQNEATDLAKEISMEQDPKQLSQLQRRYDRIQQELHSHDAYQIDHRVEEVLHGLGFHENDYHRPLTQFSGGQQNRAALARLLLRAPELMLLDEPTNHLDIAATEWLESHLAQSRAAVLLVSHDRFFLDRVTNRILELNASRIMDYAGNFSAYWSQRDERNKVLMRTYEKQQEFIEKTEDFIRRNKAGQKTKQAQDREKKLERLERVERPEEIGDHPKMMFGEPTRTGDWVIDANDLAKGFGEPLFQAFTLRINRGDRVGIVGPNGSGKTTLLRTLLGELEPDSGTVRHGTGVKIGYFDQQLTSVNPECDAVEAARPPDNPDMKPGEVRNILARFGIRGDMAFQQVGLMSGGEKSKVALARIAALNVNLLVLDEPTNHLDLWARDALETALREFPGTLLFVSHDRYFLDRVASHVIVLEPDRWRYYEGNYSDFVRFEKNRVAELAGDKPASLSAGKSGSGSNESKTSTTDRQSTISKAPAKPAKRKRKFPYRKVDDIETEIAEQEELLEHLQSQLADPDVLRDGDRVKETMQAFEETKEKLDELYEHWEEATELN